MMCNSAFDQVTQKPGQKVANCFRKGVFYHNKGEDQIVTVQVVTFVDNWEDVRHDVSYEDFVNLDENLAICGQLTGAEILFGVMN